MWRLQSWCSRSLFSIVLHHLEGRSLSLYTPHSLIFMSGVDNGLPSGQVDPPSPHCVHLVSAKPRNWEIVANKLFFLVIITSLPAWSVIWMFYVPTGKDFFGVGRYVGFPAPLTCLARQRHSPPESYFFFSFVSFSVLFSTNTPAPGLVVYLSGEWGDVRFYLLWFTRWFMCVISSTSSQVSGVKFVSFRLFFCVCFPLLWNVVWLWAVWVEKCVIPPSLPSSISWIPRNVWLSEFIRRFNTERVKWISLSVSLLEM